ncbi:AAA family ATPase [bacterium]|nr:AAA family ATPase [bacterium]
MTQDESNRLRDEINAQPEYIAEALGIARDKSGRGWVCPKCGSGSGPNGTGPTLKAGRFKCWSGGCDWGGDAVGIIQAKLGCGYIAALEWGADKLGLSIDDDGPQGAAVPRKAQEPKPKPDSQAEAKAEPEKPEEPEPWPDFTEHLAGLPRIAEHPEAVAYLEGRGLSVETADKLGLRFDPVCKTPKGRQPAVIVPLYKNAGFVMRGINPDGFKGNGKGHRAEPFNVKALAGSAPVFITEGWADALSIIEVGGKALSLNGTTNQKQLLKILAAVKSKGRDVPPLVVAFDNDEPGKAAAKKLQDELTAAGYYALTAKKLYGDAKDANEALQADRPALAYAVYRIGCQAAERIPAEDMAAALKLSDRAHFDQYRANRKKAAEAPRISTGIWRLDKVFGGGLYPGLFALGGDTGAGKTSFVLQVADSIAAAGHPVLYVALEMSRDELIAKSVARITAEADAAAGKEGFQGVPYRDLMNGRTGDKIVRAERQYAGTVAGNRFVMEGLGDVTAQDIRARATALKAATGKAPVIIVDYLQNMAAHDPHMTERQAVEYNMKALKLISRDLDAPVIVLSSLNRESLKNSDNIGLYSFKESGCIEYTADAAVLLIKGGGRPLGKEPGKGARGVALQVAKNRRGPVPPVWICLDFYAATSRFVERCAVNAPWKDKLEAAEDSEYAAFDAEEIFNRMNTEPAEPAEPPRQLSMGA